jgi:DNA-binding transcriptional MerR regulator
MSDSQNNNNLAEDNSIKNQSPWSVKGVKDDAKAVAKKQARKLGMTLGEYMSLLIEQDVDPSNSEALNKQQEPDPFVKVDDAEVAKHFDNARISVIEQKIKTLESQYQHDLNRLKELSELTLQIAKRLNLIEETMSENELIRDNPFSLLND